MSDTPKKRAVLGKRPHAGASAQKTPNKKRQREWTGYITPEKRTKQEPREWKLKEQDPWADVLRRREWLRHRRSPKKRDNTILTIDWHRFGVRTIGGKVEGVIIPRKYDRLANDKLPDGLKRRDPPRWLVEAVAALNSFVHTETFKKLLIRIVGKVAEAEAANQRDDELTDWQDHVVRQGRNVEEMMATRIRQLNLSVIPFPSEHIMESHTISGTIWISHEVSFIAHTMWQQGERILVRRLYVHARVVREVEVLQCGAGLQLLTLPFVSSLFSSAVCCQLLTRLYREEDKVDKAQQRRAFAALVCVKLLHEIFHHAMPHIKRELYQLTKHLTLARSVRSSEHSTHHIAPQTDASFGLRGCALPPCAAGLPQPAAPRARH